MELLLNLAWLLLALPAYWLWRGTRLSHAERKFNSLQCLLALGCILVVLFPVISATDDLRAMRTEMEESPVSKRSLRQASHDKGSLWNSRMQVQPALPTTPVRVAPGLEFSECFRLLLLIPAAPPSIHRTARAPPAIYFS